MTRTLRLVFLVLGAGLPFAGSPSGAAVRYVEYACSAVSPETVFVSPGDSLVWATHGECASLPYDCYYCYDVSVPGATGGPFGSAGWWGSGYWQDCNGSAAAHYPISRGVAADAIPGYYQYVIVTGPACFMTRAIYGTILVAGLPTRTMRRSWGQLKTVYR